MAKIHDDFEIIRNHCIEIRRNYNTYIQLFNEDNRDILSLVASQFFTDIAEIMQRDWILQACKLMDPATTKVKGKLLENLTVALINEQLKSQSLMTNEIEKVSESLLKYGEKIKPARHKRLAHFDREMQVNNITLGATTDSELDGFLFDIQEYCDLVGKRIGSGPLDFSGSGCKGDVLDLLKFLKKCTNA